MNMPPWIRGRWVVVPAVIAVVTGTWNLYVASHNHGRIEGRVVDAGGRPVAGASVTLYERGFVTHTPKEQTQTDASGMFRFTNNNNHAFQLQAEQPGLGLSERLSFRLWFRAQDLSLTAPLRFAGRLP